MIINWIFFLTIGNEEYKLQVGAISRDTQIYLCAKDAHTQSKIITLITN